MNSYSHVLDTAWDWEMCGGSPTSVTAMEEVSNPQPSLYSGFGNQTVNVAFREGR